MDDIVDLQLENIEQIHGQDWMRTRKAKKVKGSERASGGRKYTRNLVSKPRIARVGITAEGRRARCHGITLMEQEKTSRLF